MPAISTRSWILCSEQNIVRARDDNISGKWVNGVVLYIYIYIFRKFERKLPSISVEIGFERKRNDPGRTCFMGELEKKIIRPFFVHLYTNCNTKDLWIKSLARLKYLVCSLQIVTINKIYDQISKYN